jgi:phosphocarrier protein
MKQIEIIIKNKEGLHARPAMKFVETATGFNSKIQVKKGPKSYNAKSMMAVLSIGAVQGENLAIVAEGDDEEAAVQALQKLLTEEPD